MVLAHGTALSQLARIQREGLRPRGGGTINNWKHTVGSNKEAVYLTTSYALYFAWCGTNDKSGTALVEIKEIDEKRMQADEDAIEQVMRNHPDREPEKIRKWDMKRRTVWYRARAHMYGWQQSVAVLGTCAHRGALPTHCLGRVVLISHDTTMRLILQYGLDPTISVTAFKFLGEKYVHAQRWLFGDEPVLPLHQRSAGPANTIPGIVQCNSIDEALQYLRDVPTFNEQRNEEGEAA